MFYGNHKIHGWIPVVRDINASIATHVDQWINEENPDLGWFENEEFIEWFNEKTGVFSVC